MITRFTAIMIQIHPDYTRETGEGIEVSAGGPNKEGKWTGWISFWRDGRPHISPLLSTHPIYDSKENAIKAMIDLVDNIRKTDVTTPKERETSFLGENI